MNKFNIGDKVRFGEYYATIRNNTAGIGTYGIEFYKNGDKIELYCDEEEIELIEQDTKEETPYSESIKTLEELDKKCDEATVKAINEIHCKKHSVGLDYEKEYTKVLEENQQLRQQNESMRDIISMMGDLL
jgi:hypothetical protein